MSSQQEVFYLHHTISQGGATDAMDDAKYEGNIGQLRIPKKNRPTQKKLALSFYSLPVHQCSYPIFLNRRLHAYWQKYTISGWWME